VPLTPREPAPRIDDGLSAAPVFEIDDGIVRLHGSRCPRCGATAFPRRAVCIQCGGAPEPLRLSGAGTVHAWTLLANPPDGFAGARHYGCIDLDEGPRVLCILGDEQPHTGQRVQARPAAARRGALGFSFAAPDA